MPFPPPGGPQGAGLFSLAYDAPPLTRHNVAGTDTTKASKAVLAFMSLGHAMGPAMNSPSPRALRVDPLLGDWIAPLEHGDADSLGENIKPYDAVPSMEEASECQEVCSASASDRMDWMTTTIESSDGAGDPLEDVSDFSPPTGRSHQYCLPNPAERAKLAQRVPRAVSSPQSPSSPHYRDDVQDSEHRLPTTPTAELLRSAASARYCQRAPTPRRSCVQGSVAAKEELASSWFLNTRKVAPLSFLCHTCCTSDPDLTQTLEVTSQQASPTAVLDDSRGRSLPLCAENYNACLRDTSTTGVSPQELVQQLTAAEAYAGAIISRAEAKRKFCKREAQRQAAAEVESFTNALEQAHKDVLHQQEEQRRADANLNVQGAEDAASVGDADVDKALEIIQNHVLSVDLSIPPRTVAMLRRTHNAPVAVESHSGRRSLPTLHKGSSNASSLTTQKCMCAERVGSFQLHVSAEANTSKPTMETDTQFPAEDRAPQKQGTSNDVLVEGLTTDQEVGKPYRSNEGQVLFTKKGRRRIQANRSFFMFFRKALIRKRKDLS